MQFVIVFAFTSTFDTDTTFAPRLASISDVVAPIPCPSSGGLPAPATTITLPDKSQKLLFVDNALFVVSTNALLTTRFDNILENI